MHFDERVLVDVALIELSLKTSRLDLALQYAQLAVKSTSTSLYSARLDQLSAKPTCCRYLHSPRTGTH